MASRKKLTERIEIPPEFADMMRSRTDDLIRACMWEPNIIESIAFSCYQQGCMDTLQLIEQRPGFVEEYRAVGAPNPDEPGYGSGV